MILPKGTIEFTTEGGEGRIGEIVERMTGGKVTGYILALGKLEVDEGNESEITGQLVFQEGSPVLCEAALGSDSHKGGDGMYLFLKSLLLETSSIEIHAKVDVGPPMAFFKECAITKELLDIDSFMKRFKREEEEKIKRTEEERRKLLRKKEMIGKMKEWTKAGYEIEESGIKDDIPFEQLEDIFSSMSKAITRLEEIEGWLETLGNPEIQKDKDMIGELLHKPSELPNIEKVVEKLKKEIEGLTEKRGEIEKWVNLWKSEGYNTSLLDKAIKGDLETSWNALTQFMDKIQHLKDRAEELKSIAGREEAGCFRNEVREIESLLTDPGEMRNIETLLGKLKNDIDNDQKKKKELMAQMIKWKEDGFSTDMVESSFGKRYNELEKVYELFKKGADKIQSLRSELDGLDRRDIPKEIDTLRAEMTDPAELLTYEKRLKELVERVKGLKEERKKLQKEVEELDLKGYNISSIEKKLDSPIVEFKEALEVFRKSIKELEDLTSEIDQLDQRWMEEEFQKLMDLLKDPSNIEKIKTSISGLKSMIGSREERRGDLKARIGEWKEEGYNIASLEMMIDESQEEFESSYEELKSSIEKAQPMLEKLAGLDLTYFKTEGAEVRAKLQDPSLLDNGIQSLERLEEDVGADSTLRMNTKQMLDKLKKDGFKVKAQEGLLTMFPSELRSGAELLEEHSGKLNLAQSDVDSWDPLEVNWLSKEVEEAKKQLRNLDEFDEALQLYTSLKEKIEGNKAHRGEVRNQMKRWKESGYITVQAESEIEGPMDKLDTLFEELSVQITALEKYQGEFDRLNTKHFRSEAEELEFKLNDPALTDEIKEELEQLKGRIEEDEKRRGEYRNRIEVYVGEGFEGAEGLKEVLDQDLSIVELEFRNFQKEVENFKNTRERLKYKSLTDSTTTSVASEGEKDPISDLKLVSHFTFENFVVGNSNRFAAKAAEAVADNPSESYNPLFIYGGTGLGKTHLVNAIGNNIVGKGGDKKVIYLTTEKFTKDMINSISKDRIEEFREHYRKADVLLIDDVEFISGKEAIQEEFFNTFNLLFNSGSQIVITSDRPPNKIPKLADRLRSRFEGGLMVDISPPELETRFAILQREVERKGVDIPDDVKTLLAERITDNVRVLEGAINRMVATSKMDNRPLDVELAGEVIDIMLEKEEEGEKAVKEEEKAEEEEGEKAVKEEEKAEEEEGEKAVKGEEKAEEEEEKVEGEGEKSVGDGVETVICTNCNERIPADVTACPHCGASFEGEVYECPICHAEVVPGSEKCDNCGAEFQI